jgi:hypothetical protein
MISLAALDDFSLIPRNKMLSLLHANL